MIGEKRKSKEKIFLEIIGLQNFSFKTRGFEGLSLNSGLKPKRDQNRGLKVKAKMA